MYTCVIKGFVNAGGTAGIFQIIRPGIHFVFRDFCRYENSTSPDILQSELFLTQWDPEGLMRSMK